MSKLIELKEMKVLAIRTHSSVEELPNLIGSSYEQIMTYLASKGSVPAGPPFIGYYNMDMSNLDVEIGFPVKENIEESDNIKMSIVPGGQYAEHIHIGPYPSLKEGYNTLMKWIEKEQLQVSGTCYEFYLNDPAQVKAEALETQILFKV